MSLSLSHPPDPSNPIHNSIRIAALLRRVLPDDVVLMILDSPDLWVPLARSHQTTTKKVTKRSSGTTILTCILPRTMPANRVRRVQAQTTTSGFFGTSPVGTAGSSPSSRAWVDVGVREDEVVVGHQHDLSWMLDADGHRVPPAEIATPTVSPLHPRYFAGPQKTYTVAWDVMHDDSKVRTALTRVKGGDTVDLCGFVTRSHFVMYAYDSAIEVDGVFVRRL